MEQRGGFGRKWLRGRRKGKEEGVVVVELRGWVVMCSATTDLG